MTDTTDIVFNCPLKNIDLLLPKLHEVATYSSLHIIKQLNPDNPLYHIEINGCTLSLSSFRALVHNIHEISNISYYSIANKNASGEELHDSWDESE